MQEISTKQKVFVDYYCGEAAQNATRAYILAGYSKIGADGNAHRLIVKDRIRQAIAKKQMVLAKKQGYSVEQAQIEYEEARALAMKINQPAAAATAVTGKARLFGFDKDANIGEKTVIIISPKVSHVVESVPVEPPGGQKE